MKILLKSNLESWLVGLFLGLVDLKMMAKAVRGIRLKDTTLLARMTKEMQSLVRLDNLRKKR